MLNKHLKFNTSKDKLLISHILVSFHHCNKIPEVINLGGKIYLAPGFGPQSLDSVALGHKTKQNIMVEVHGGWEAKRERMRLGFHVFP
jgi:hypothetical protein